MYTFNDQYIQQSALSLSKTDFSGGKFMFFTFLYFWGHCLYFSWSMRTATVTTAFVSKTYEWDPYVSAFPWFLSSSWRCYCLFWCNLHNLSFNVSFKTNYIHFIYVHKYVSTINTIARKENFHKITTCTLFINLPYNSIETKFFIK
jgi:hypothetical protein